MMRPVLTTRLPLVALLALTLASAPALADTRRLALVVGSNAGGGDLPPLRYAEADAGKMARVMVELGDVAADDMVLLQGRPVGEVEAAIQRLRGRVEKAKASPEARTVLLFYFSGHSDGEGIELGREALPYSRLKSLLAGTGADVRLVIIDACRSGNGFKQKGARPVDGFSIKMADQLNATGEAFITSSAEDEAALESAEVMGSIFTHHLVSGLRGAADLSGDKLVTLAEAYRYAYDQTVTRTAMTTAGAQHPNYDFRISGQGELVLTSLQKPSASIVFPSGAERSVVTDVLRDQVVVELPASAGREAALPPGQYGVRLFKEGKSFGGRITLADGARRTLKWDELEQVSASVQVARKGADVVRTVAVPERDWQDYRVASLAAGLTTPIVQGVAVVPDFRLAFEPSAGAGLSFAALAAFYSAGSVAESRVEARAGWRMAWLLGPVNLLAGAEAGPVYAWQVVGAASGGSLAGVLSPRATARLVLGGPVVLALDVDAALYLTPLNGKVTTAFRPAASLGLAFRF